MKTAKQILAGFQTEAAKIKNHAEMQAFKEQYLQRALDEAWKEAVKECATVFWEHECTKEGISINDSQTLVAAIKAVAKKRD